MLTFMNLKFNNIQKYSIFLFYSSFWMLFAMIISFIMKDLYISLYFLFLFLTSINHWRKYEYGIRRNIDLFVVYIGIIFLLLQVCLLKNEFNRFIVLSVLLCCFIFYMIEFICVYFNSNKWVIYHMTIHLYASLVSIYVLID